MIDGDPGNEPRLILFHGGYQMNLDVSIVTKKAARVRPYYIIFTVVTSILMGTVVSAQGLTSSQRNAVRSANAYLNVMPFSRAGLIEQLSSSYGDGYDRRDATAAVDSLSINWSAQAVKAAEQYLSLMGFSCSGLIEQLSSSAGDKYTQSEATYGAQQAGAC